MNTTSTQGEAIARPYGVDAATRLDAHLSTLAGAVALDRFASQYVTIRAPYSIDNLDARAEMARLRSGVASSPDDIPWKD